MNTYKRHRFPSDIISYAVWLYYRFNLTYRDIEDLLAERGIVVTLESIRFRCIKFGAAYARRLKRKHRGYGDTFYTDEGLATLLGRWRSDKTRNYSESAGGSIPFYGCGIRRASYCTSS